MLDLFVELDALVTLARQLFNQERLEASKFELGEHASLDGGPSRGRPNSRSFDGTPKMRLHLGRLSWWLFWG